MEIQLTKLLKGQKAVVSKILEGNTSQRLLELGLIPGTEFLIKSIAPFKSSFALQMDYFSLSIRKEDAENIFVEIQ